LIRTLLTNDQWERIAPHLPGKPGDPGRHGRNNRLFIEAVLFVARTGTPWRDLPTAFGNWYTVYTRFWRWAQKDVWERIFKALSDDPDFEYILIDATLMRVHQHGTGAKGGLKIRPLAGHAAV
jgi:putative transposase